MVDDNVRSHGRLDNSSRLQMGLSMPRAFEAPMISMGARSYIDQILARNELERQRNGGVFLWGIGSANGRPVR
jgi:hypothetical protein